MHTDKLHAAAQQLVTTYTTPGQFLAFISDAINWCNQYSKMDRENNGIFFLQVIIEKTVIPWTESDDQPCKEIAKGLRDISSDFVANYVYQQLGSVAMAQIEDSNKSGESSEEYCLVVLQGMQALFSLAESLADYEREKNRKAA